jgi:starch synthase
LSGVHRSGSVRLRRVTGIMATDHHDIDTSDHPVRILHIASEAVPWVKTGGLADVVGALGSHLAAHHDVTVALPRYRSLGDVSSDGRVSVAVSVGDHAARVSYGLTEEGPGLLLVDAPELYDREGPYGSGGADYADNAIRFAVFVRAALVGALELGLGPELVHAHDWHGALAPLYCRILPGYESVPVVFTVHNLAYQGVFAAADLGGVALPEDEATRAALAQESHINFLKAAIVSADRVTTVSPTYAREIETPALGFGLDEWIATLDPPVHGILNGIDTEVWNPATDPYLAAPFDRADLSGKARCKASIQEELGLPVRPDTPLFGMVTRLITQKGLGLIEALGDDFVRRDAQFAFLGTGEARFETMIADLAARHGNVAARVEFSEALAHRIEAGSDFFLVPSEFEPCGLTQMISQRYGTVPIVHRVGGLADSVTHASPEAVQAGEATGIVFESFDAPALSWALDHALGLYSRAADLRGVRETAMELDHSWRRSGLEYEELYRRTLQQKRGDD